MYSSHNALTLRQNPTPSDSCWRPVGQPKLRCCWRPVGQHKLRCCWRPVGQHKLLRCWPYLLHPPADSSAYQASSDMTHNRRWDRWERNRWWQDCWPWSWHAGETAGNHRPFRHSHRTVQTKRRSPVPWRACSPSCLGQSVSPVSLSTCVHWSAAAKTDWPSASTQTSFAKCMACIFLQTLIQPFRFATGSEE